LKFSGNANGIAISNLVVNSATSAVAVAHGNLPLTFRPGAPTNQIHFDSEKPLQLIASAQPNAVFWDALADWTGMVLRDPNLNANISGTWPTALGKIQLQAQQIQFRKGAKRIPKLEALRLDVQLDRQQARVAECQVLVER